MKWFKHLTTAADDPVLVDILERFGAAGYGVYWRLVEIVGREIKTPQDPPQVRMMVETWARMCGLRTRKGAPDISAFLALVGLLEDRGKIEVEWFLDGTRSGADGTRSGQDGTRSGQHRKLTSVHYLTIGLPKILKYCDEWIRKHRSHSGDSPEQVRSHSYHRSRIEVDKKRKDFKDLPADVPETSAVGPSSPPPGPGNGPENTRREKCTVLDCSRRPSLRVAGRLYCRMHDPDKVEPGIAVDLGKLLSDSEKFLGPGSRSVE